MSRKETIEFVGVPGSGKTTIAQQIADERGLSVVPQTPSAVFLLLCILRYPLFVVVWVVSMVYEGIHTRTLPLTRFKLSVFANTCSRFMYARIHGGVLDEGFAQRLLSLYEHPVSVRVFKMWLWIMPFFDTIAVTSRAQTKISHIRKQLGEESIRRWQAGISINKKNLEFVLSRKNIKIIHV